MRGALATMADVDMKVDMEEEELEEIPPYSVRAVQTLL